VELLLTIGNYLMRARVMTTLEIEVDAAAWSAVVDAVSVDCSGGAPRC
jgi:hypothetical protein